MLLCAILIVVCCLCQFPDLFDISDPFDAEVCVLDDVFFQVVECDAVER